LALAIFVEMQRPPEFWWTPDQLLDTSLRSNTAKIEEQCSALIVTDVPAANDASGVRSRVGPPYLQAINAVVLSVLTGVPTPQGYARDAPIGHPGVFGDAKSLIQWSRARGVTGPICEVSSSGVRVVS
jgi:hypothetical protein